MPIPYSVQSHARVVRLRPFMKTALALVLTFPLLASVHDARAAPQPITFTEALQQAVVRSRQLHAQDQATVAAHEMAVAVAQRPDPTLKVGIDNVPLSGSDRFSLSGDFMTMRRIGISQELTRADKLRWRSARLEREADKAQAQKDVALAAIQRDTAISWLNVYYIRKMSVVLTEQVVFSRQEIDAATAVYRGGRGSQADVLAARSALLTIEDRTSQVERDLNTAKNMLVRWTGSSGELAEASMPDLGTIPLDPALLDTELAHRPQIMVLNRQEEAAQADVNLAQANRRPDWSIEFAFQQRGAAYSNMVSVGLSLPLQWDRKNRQDRELSSKLALVEQARSERDELLREDAANIRALLIEWRSGQERSERYALQLLPLADERSQAVLASYRGGKASLAEVLAARRNSADMHVQLLQLQMNTAQFWAQLRFLFPDIAITQISAVHRQQEFK